MLLNVGKPTPLVEVTQLLHAMRDLVLQRSQGRTGFTDLLRRLTLAYVFDGGSDVAQQSFAFTQGDRARFDHALGAGHQPRELRDLIPCGLRLRLARRRLTRLERL